jgi:diguanylate cyclase (GGDEF)-like protein/PAS domain S-box-containing protein
VNDRLLDQESFTHDDPSDVTESSVARVPDDGDVARRLTLSDSMLRAIPEHVYVFNLRTGEYVHSNGDPRTFLGYAPAEVDHLTDAEFARFVAHPDDVGRYLEMLSEHRSLKPGDRLSRRVQLRHGTGDFRWYHHIVVGMSFDVDGVVETLGTLNDVTVIVEAAQQLQESERRFRELFHRSPAGTVVIDDDGAVLEANDAMGALVGIPRAELIGTRYDDLVHPEERADVEQRRRVMAADGTVAAQVQRRLLNVDGTIRWVQVQITRIREHDRFVTLLAFEDVTAARASREQLKHAALHDSLTGLPNRRLLADRLERAVVRSRRTGSLTAVLFLDLDRVKAVNDSHGHGAGDALLCAVGQRLTTTVRETDTVARVGGDEFVIVCDAVATPDEVTALADRVLAVVAAPITLGDACVNVTASIGIATTTGDATSDELIRAADLAMYEAKSAGRARAALASQTV